VASPLILLLARFYGYWLPARSFFTVLMLLPFFVFLLCRHERHASTIALLPDAAGREASALFVPIADRFDADARSFMASLPSPSFSAFSLILLLIWRYPIFLPEQRS